MPTMKKNVTVSQADNGYTVSCYGGKGEAMVICKTMDEVFKAVKKMLRSKDVEYDEELGEKVVGHM